MKTHLNFLFLLPALLAGLGLLLAGRVPAQTFTTLHSFTAGGYYSFGVYIPNSDGTDPVAGLTIEGNTLYGTANQGGSAGIGTVFKVIINGTGITNLHNFTADPPYYNSGGIRPRAGLVLSDNRLYGTTQGGHSIEFPGTVFAVNTDGSDFTNLHEFFGTLFNGNDGANPYAGLILSGNTLYGTTFRGSTNNNGTIFKINTDGTGFTNLYYFTASGTNSSGVFTNSDGGIPAAGLVLLGSTLYRTAVAFGSYGAGTVFAVNTDGTGFTNLHSFMVRSTNSSGFYTNFDGTSPRALILSGNTLYGTAASGGSSGNGTVFALNTDGTDFTNLHNFTGYPSDGASPWAILVLSGNTLYGTTSAGGSSGNGTVFSLSFAPQLTLIPSGVPPSGIIVSWPTNVAGFDYTGYTLQSTTNLAAPAVWSTNSPAPVVVNGQFTVTNLITGDQMFYLLSQ